MYFSWKNFAVFLRRALHPPPDSPYRLTLKRAATLAGFLGLFLATELATRIGFGLDHLLYPRHTDTEIEDPVFIIGNPRSGTTFLHRLLAQDTRSFTTMRLWEILFAPSIVQRRVTRALAGLDRTFGSPLHRHIARWDAKVAQSNELHNAEILSPEEDQFVLVHCWSTLAIWHFSGILEEAGPYTYFDTAVPQEEKQRIIDFYRRAIQRHLYAARLGGRSDLHYLAKNPSASPKVDTLLDTFPGARFVYLVRTPLEMIPSMISCLDFTWRVLGDPPHPYAARDYVLEMAKHWYTYPLERLALRPESSHIILTFEEVTQHAERAVRRIYDRFGLTLRDPYGRILREEAAKARAYKSNHHYDLNAMGLSAEQIMMEFGEVFDKFGFDRAKH